MLLLDLSHTSHSPARTGVQRVSLQLRDALRRAGAGVTEITHDPYAQHWRALRAWELRSLDQSPAANSTRRARWPWPARLRGCWTRFIGDRTRALAGLEVAPTGLICPEIPTGRTAAAMPALLRAVAGPRVAIFHDAIPLRLPDLSPPGTVARFPTYLEELRRFDGIAAVSEDSRQSLLDYWSWSGGYNTHRRPEVVALPLGCDHLKPDDPAPAPPSAGGSRSSAPTVLCVGSLEGRKNHLALLEACEHLWRTGEHFELELVGGLQRETGRTAHERLRALQSAGRPLRWHGWRTEAELNRAFRVARFTVYPSLLEGFGLPVWESLVHGKPCVCSPRGALGETARGGGCLTVDPTDVTALADTLRRLLHDDTLLAELTRQARARPLPSWSDYARRLEAWMQTLPRQAEDAPQGG